MNTLMINSAAQGIRFQEASAIAPFAVFEAVIAQGRRLIRLAAGVGRLAEPSGEVARGASA